MAPSKPQLPATEPRYDPRFVSTLFLLFLLLSGISYAKPDLPSVEPSYDPRSVRPPIS